MRPGVTTAHPILEGFSDNVCVNAALRMAGYICGSRALVLEQGYLSGTLELALEVNPRQLSFITLSRP